MRFRREKNMDKIQQLAEYIDQSHSMVAITGAGISLAGGGITYSQLSRAVRLEDFGSDDFLRSYVKAMHNYKPSFSHYALRDLEAAGKLTGIITTNEDCMHTMAGSKNVAEIQGGFQVNRCEKCGRHYDGYEIWKQEDLPKCESCGGRILPWELYSHISLWEEGVQKAREWISGADLILVIGTNGYYGSAYWSCRRKDAVIVQINPGHTGFDRIADLNIREECDDVFRKLMAARMRAAEYKGLSEEEIREREQQKEERKKKNIEILGDTLKILEAGSFEKNGQEIKLQFSSKQMREVQVFLPEDIDMLRAEKGAVPAGDDTENDRNRTPQNPGCTFSCENIDALELAQKKYFGLKESGESDPKVLVLNLASSVQPGGQTRKGASAQEEDLCRRTSLLLSLESDEAKKYYEYNIALKTQMGSDGVMISPCVEVLKDACARVLSEPFPIAVMSCAAPMIRMGLEGMTQQEYEEMLCRRIQGMLLVAASKGCRHLILGAFGCGVFGNDAAVVSDLFYRALQSFSFDGRGSDRQFDSIDFAVLCRPGKDYNYREFCRNFSQEK